MGYYLITSNDAKNLLSNCDENMCLSFCKLNSLKILIVLNHCKCTDRTTNKSGFSLSLDIVPTRIEDGL